MFQFPARTSRIHPTIGCKIRKQLEDAANHPAFFEHILLDVGPEQRLR